MTRHAVHLIVLIFLASVVAPSRVAAQVGFGKWETIASGDEILTLAADPTNTAVIWAGTEGGGLVRWDLASTTFTQHLFPQQPGLMSNQVRDIAFDSQGAPWLATSAGVTYAGGSPWIGYGLSAGLPSDDITAVAVLGDDTVWAGSRSQGLAELAPGSNAWVPVAFDDTTLGTGVNSVSSMVVSPVDGTLWVAHGRAQVGAQPALSVYDPAAAEWEHIDASAPGSDPSAGPLTDQILDLAFDEDGMLWMASWSQGVLTYDPVSDTWGRYDTADGLCGTDVWSVFAGDDLWVACARVAGGTTVGDGVSQWTGSGWETYTVADGLPTDTIASVVSVNGIAYLAANGPGDGGAGIVPLDHQAGESITTYPQTPFTNDITAVAFDDVGQPWVGTRGFGLMTRENGVWERFTQDSTDGALAGDLITDLAWSDGVLWIASTKWVYQSGAGYVDGGVSSFQPATGSWRTLTVADGLPDADVSSVLVADDGDVWIGVGAATGSPGVADSYQHGDGIAVYDPAADDFIDYFSYNDTTGGLIGDTITGLAADGDTIWAAASYHIDADQRRRGGGVSRYENGSWSGWGGDEAGFKTHHGSGNPVDQDPFITGDVRSVGVASDGLALAGTWDLDSGNLQLIWPFVDAVVNRWNGSSWSSTTWAGSGWVSDIAVDSAGRAWAGTTRGHGVREYDLAGGGVADTAVGGVHVMSGGSWVDLTPDNSGLASSAITSIAVRPLTDDVWISTENSGMSVFYAGEIPPTATPGGPTATEYPTPTSTSSGGISTVAPTSAPVITNTPGGAPPPVVPTSTPKPPKEVPEAGTLLLLGLGLAGLAAWRKRQQREPEAR